MILTDLNIHHLRPFPEFKLNFSEPFINIIGPNGCGKTSILEAIYLLGSGHSFRTRDASSIIRHEQDSLTVYGALQDGTSVSVQKNKNAPSRVKINDRFCTASSELAYLLPCQVIYQDIFSIIDAGPSERRSVLDWGMFHVKHSYLGLWKKMMRIIKQRNALLKQHPSRQSMDIWNSQLAEISEEVDKERTDYCRILSGHFEEILKELTSATCSIDYYRGWDRKEEGKPLAQILVESHDVDIKRQYTQYGPHQADLIFSNKDSQAKKVLSRGQQKIILIALKLAQAKMLEKECVFLFDDYSAELDESHQKRLWIYLNEKMKGQFFISSIVPLNWKQWRGDSRVQDIILEDVISSLYVLP